MRLALRTRKLHYDAPSLLFVRLPRTRTARKAKSVRNLAERLLAARLKLFETHLAALQPIAEGKKQRSVGIESLKERVAQTKAEGMSRLLVEFGARDALV
jgi:hypothetical protein